MSQKNALSYLVRFTCDPLGDGIQEETLEVIIKQLIGSWKYLTVCSIHCLSKTVSKVLELKRKGNKVS